MVLEVHERFVLVQLLPKEHTYAGMTAIRELRENLSFTTEEVDFLEMEEVPNPQGGLDTKWNNKKAQKASLEVPIGKFMTGVIQTILANMEKAGKLREEHLSLYEKFVLTYTSDDEIS